ncbi:hypothetical protein D1818_24380 [Aquimarina sp. BL5]|uniref:hypothetical protein n=1 Tax=Aquimarina sp. BL5 TaxID=1714860 RepID=UPI000E46C2AF|nr:hypothetical protein [Aquimarina sp. BL5]AXT53804.1 hypothetical protein D1818_24380 [Aquimarina sp. BL5]RKM98575.1 hypothetical protein D7036_19880 [Aquimarina sp. BL5]
MKKVVLVLLVLFLSCKNNKHPDLNNGQVIVQQTNKNIKETIADNQNSFTIEELIGQKLIGMESNQDDKENDPYKKYSVDFTGACYSSDLCVIEVNKNQLAISNYYDPKIKVKIDIENIISEDNKLILKLKNDSLTKLTLTKFINDLSLYKIEINGSSVTEEIRMSKYIANENIISKFGGIDCGNFDG